MYVVQPGTEIENQCRKKLFLFDIIEEEKDGY